MNDLIKAKFGETHDISWVVNADLTGGVLSLTASNDDLTVALNVRSDAPSTGVIFHTLTGTLPIGSYWIELSMLRFGQLTKIPTDGFAALRILPAL